MCVSTSYDGESLTEPSSIRQNRFPAENSNSERSEYRLFREFSTGKRVNLFLVEDNGCPPSVCDGLTLVCSGKFCALIRPPDGNQVAECQIRTLSFGRVASRSHPARHPCRHGFAFIRRADEDSVFRHYDLRTARAAVVWDANQQARPARELNQR